MADVFIVQDEIAARIVVSIEPEIIGPRNGARRANILPISAPGTML